jgi:hypothetical protein
MYERGDFTPERWRFFAEREKLVKSVELVELVELVNREL